MSKNGKKILLVAATRNELGALALPVFSHLSVKTLVTGVGMVATAFSLTQDLARSKADLVLDIGIAGAFGDSLEIGDVVQVVTDRLVELGAEDGSRFIPADVLGLMDAKDMLFVSDVPADNLVSVSGITVNRVHGNAASIRKTTKQFDPDVESMEGAAVGYVCWKMGFPWVQIRAISNRVESRNRESWAIGLAIQNLHYEVSRFLQHLDDDA